MYQLTFTLSIISTCTVIHWTIEHVHGWIGQWTHGCSSFVKCLSMTVSSSEGMQCTLMDMYTLLWHPVQKLVIIEPGLADKSDVRTPDTYPPFVLCCTPQDFQQRSSNWFSLSKCFTTLTGSAPLSSLSAFTLHGSWSFCTWDRMGDVHESVKLWMLGLAVTD